MEILHKKLTQSSLNVTLFLRNFRRTYVLVTLICLDVEIPQLNLLDITNSSLLPVLRSLPIESRV